MCIYVTRLPPLYSPSAPCSDLVCPFSRACIFISPSFLSWIEEYDSYIPYILYLDRPSAPWGPNRPDVTGGPKTRAHPRSRALSLGSLQYKVKDINLADFGRMELDLAEVEMPGLMACR